MTAWLDALDHRLTELKHAHLLRTLRTLDGPQGPSVVFEGRSILNFSSNDYLGLANHPALLEAVDRAARDFGVGAGASRLISGNLRPHQELEETLAAFKKKPAALLFSSGYTAALGVITALLGAGDVIVLDKLCHACLIDAARMSGATLRVFPHNDMARLESHLRWAKEKSPGAKVLILAEAVYSMDGDVAPLPEILALKQQYGAVLLLDEAHATGVLGKQGEGLSGSLQLQDQVDILMGTLGKALGSSGGYICGSALLRDFLINSARSFIFSTAPTVPAVAAARAALELLQQPEGRERITALSERRLELATAWQMPGPSAVFPFKVGSEEKAMRLAAALLDRHRMWVPAIRYPTVARASARLRISLSAGHSSGDIDLLVEALNAN